MSYMSRLVSSIIQCLIWPLIFSFCLSMEVYESSWNLVCGCCGCYWICGFRYVRVTERQIYFSAVKEFADVHTFCPSIRFIDVGIFRNGFLAQILIDTRIQLLKKESFSIVWFLLFILCQTFIIGDESGQQTGESHMHSMSTKTLCRSAFKTVDNQGKELISMSICLSERPKYIALNFTLHVMYTDAPLHNGSW